MISQALAGCPFFSPLSLYPACLRSAYSLAGIASIKPPLRACYLFHRMLQAVRYIGWERSEFDRLARLFTDFLPIDIKDQIFLLTVSIILLVGSNLNPFVP